MTLEEAKKVAAICETADGGCFYCAADLCEQLAGAFTEFDWKWDDLAGIVVSEKA
jgi:hypothetical protein